MEKKTYPLYHAGKLMPWSKGTVIKDAKGFVFLSGTEGRDPETDEVVEGIAAQTRLAFEKIKSRLEEMGSSLENICSIRTYIVGPEFPDGIEADPKWQASFKARTDFLKEHCPQLCYGSNPPAGALIGVSGLGKKEMLIEVDVIAAIPDE